MDSIMNEKGLLPNKIRIHMNRAENSKVEQAINKNNKRYGMKMEK